MEPILHAVGDSAIQVNFGNDISPTTNQRVSGLAKAIQTNKLAGIIDLTPTFNSLLIHYDPLLLPYAQIREYLISMSENLKEGEAGLYKVHEIPVLYGKEHGPDLDYVAKNSGLTAEQVIDLHSSKEYLIYMLGFMPGFPYLGGLEEILHTPRLAVPRKLIPAGSVGIGGAQTGIYPLDSPGGWQLIGQTPLNVYEQGREKPVLYEAGDYIRFVPITKEQFDEMKTD